MTFRPTHAPAVCLRDLVSGQALGPVDGRIITGITLDSRVVERGWLYVALPGSRVHGAVFAPDAVAAGAAAVLTDRSGASLLEGVDAPVLVAEDLRSTMAEVAARLFGFPATKLETFGITGTNGKTTTAFLIEAALTDRRVATIGTIGFRLGEIDLTGARSTVTTPESPDLQALLAGLVELGAQAAAIEVSSHALELARVGSITFDHAGFINLGQDHLDFHHDMDSYFEAKAKLFTTGMCREAVINIAEPPGRELARRASAQGIPVITIGVPEAQYWVSGFRNLDPVHTAAVLHTPTGSHELRLGMPGAYNMTNATMAFAMAISAGCEPQDALSGLARARVPGRMQAVELGSDAPLAVVDFAHTPQAVAAALSTFAGIRPQRRVISVLGAGGDRDPAKRRLMGQAAGQYCDLVVVTDDNPRGEDPSHIRAGVLEGLVGHPGAIEVAGRGAAIGKALSLAEPGDVVAILGKGHERGQIIGSEVIEFDDVAVVQREWTAFKEDS